MTSFRLAIFLTLLLSIATYGFEKLPDIIRIIELKTLDWRFQMRGPIDPGDHVAIVGIDEQSIKDIGRWPWPRKVHAGLVNHLEELGAKTIGFDLILSEKERSTEMQSLLRIKNVFSQKMAEQSENENVQYIAKDLDQLIENADNDQIFAEAMKKQNNTIVSVVFDYDPNLDNIDEANPSLSQAPTETSDNSAEENQDEDIPFDLFDQEDKAPNDNEPQVNDQQGSESEEIPFDLFDQEDAPSNETESSSEEAPPFDLFDEENNDVQEPEEETFDLFLTEKVRGTAIQNISGDPKQNFDFYNQANKPLSSIPLLEDSAKDVGHVNFFQDIDGNLRWADLIIDYKGKYYPSFNLQLLKHHLDLKDDEIELIQGKGLKYGQTHIPLDKQGRLLISFYGKKFTIPYISASKVLLNKESIQENQFKDKIVLIGAAATGLGDVWATPFSTNMPGVEKHATVIANILNQDFLSRPKNMDLYNALFVGLIGIILGLFIPKVNSITAAIVSATMLCLVTGVAFFSFNFLGLWLNLSMPIFSIIFLTASIIAFRFFIEEREKKKIKGAFERYLSPDLVDDLVKHPDKLKLGGEMRDLTVLFSDIRNFTSMSEGLSPEELVHIINTYLSQMTDIILDTKGYVDKFIGDAIMAIYGAPVYDETNAESACLSAWKMIEVLKVKKVEWESQGFPVINIGIGLNTGPMLSGNMGSSARFDYTVMGDAVNLGSRLEGLTKAYGADIIVSESTRNKTNPEFKTREIDFVRVKGKEEPIRIYELIGVPGDNERIPKAELDLYWQARSLYLKAEFSEALKLYEQLQAQSPHILYDMYVKRCEHFLKEAAPENWDGVMTYTTK